MFCPHCGNQIADNALFCPHCGNSTAAQAPNAAPQQPFAAPQQPYSQQQTWQANPQQDQQQAWQGYQQQNYQQQYPQQGYQQQYQQPYPQQDQQQAWQGYQQPYAQPVTAKKRSGKKGLFIGLGCVALAALVGGGIWFLTRKGSDSKLEKLAAPAEKSLTALEDYVEELPNLKKITTSLEEMSDTKKLRMAMDFVNETVLKYGDTENSYGMTVKADLSMDQDAGKVLVTGSYASDGVEAPFTLYVDSDQLQIASTAVLDAGEALSLPLKDLPKQWNASALGKLTGVTLPDDLDLSGITNADPEESLKSYYGEDWTKFMDSLDTVPYEGTPYFTGSGTTKTLTWDKQALKAMMDKTDLDMENMVDIDDLDDLSKLDLGNLAAQATVSILGTLDEQIKEIQFYEENDTLTGLYLETAGEDALKISIRLDGEQNPWEHITCTSIASYSSYTVTDTFEAKLTKANGQLRIDVTTNHEDSDGAEYSYSEGPYTVVYNDADGKVSFEEEGEAVENAPDVHLTPADGGFTLAIASTSGSEDYKNVNSETFTFTGKPGPIQAPSANPTNLLALSEEELQALLERIEKNASSFFGG